MLCISLNFSYFDNAFTLAVKQASIRQLILFQTKNKMISEQIMSIRFSQRQPPQQHDNQIE